MIKKRNLSDIGAMKHQIDILIPVEVKEADGGILISYEPFRTSVWCAVGDAKSEIWRWENIDIQSRGIKSKLFKKFTIRYDPLVNDSMRVVYRQYMYTIQEIAEVGEESRYLELRCYGEKPMVTQEGY